MSASKAQLSEYGKEISNETSKSRAPEVPLRLSNGIHSSHHSSPKAAQPSPSGTQREQPQSGPRQPPATFATSAPPPNSLSSSRSPSFERSSVNSPGASSSIALDDSNREIKDIIIRSFAPRVAIFASTDTEDFIKGKGFKDGLCGLVRPYGERLHGKVIIRDSVGGSKAWDDFGIRFVKSQHLHRSKSDQPTPEAVTGSAQDPVSDPRVGSESRSAIDSFLDHHLNTENVTTNNHESEYFDRNGIGTSDSRLHHSPLFQHYLRKLLSITALVPYETFSHPVACMVAVSSRHPAPIDALRQLYASTGYGTDQTPVWMGTECLRYYVLIHDEENDDITKSTALFDLMKRHFGLHCHLLRLRASQCVPSDDDTVKVPRCVWLSAEEDLEHIRAKEDYINELDGSENHISETDAAAVRAFLREMVTQSIVPFMENRVMTWNDQVASRRRGISGRFISLSKRWTGFGSSRNVPSSPGAATGSSGSNYNHQQGFYPPGTPEATMRQLGDYAFMLRDWRLAFSTYDFLRTDFSHDKAWAYYAAVNEMAAISSLLISQTFTSRLKSENIDQMLDNAAYSYLTRCSMPTNAIRCVTLAIELLQARGSFAIDDAARWGNRLLEFNVLSSFAQTLMTERLADCYAFRPDSSPTLPNGRRRQAALWNVLAADCWIQLDKLSHARLRLQSARELYDTKDDSLNGPPFTNMRPLWQRLDDGLGNVASQSPSALIDLRHDKRHEPDTDQESEQLNSLTDLVYSSDPDTEGFVSQDARHPDLTNLNNTLLLNDGFE